MINTFLTFPSLIRPATSARLASFPAANEGKVGLGLNLREMAEAMMVDLKREARDGVGEVEPVEEGRAATGGWKEALGASRSDSESVKSRVKASLTVLGEEQSSS